MNIPVALVIFSVASGVHAQTCLKNTPRTAPDSRYELVHGSGGSEVLDKKTKLIWQRCSVGQSWNGNACIGTASSYVWPDALRQAKNYGNGWRLPNIKELQSLVEDTCHKSSINEVFFPATFSGRYGSSSPYFDSRANIVWFVNFDTGASGATFAKDIPYYHVRAVRTAP